MAELTVLVPGSLERLTGGTLYDKRIVQGLRALGWTVDVHEISGTFPDGAIPPWITGLVICMVVLFYVFYGGLRGAAWANTSSS